MVFESFDRLWKIRAILFHLLVVITSIVVSVWNSVSIVRTFTYDNQLTIVHSEMSNLSEAPFAENLTIKAFFHDSVIPKHLLRNLGGNLTSLRTSEYYRRLKSAVQDANVSLGSINVSTIDGLITAMLLVSEVSDLDYMGHRCNFFGRDSCDNITSEYCPLHDYSRTKLFQSHRRNGTQLERIEEELFSRLNDELFWTADDRSRFTIHTIKCAYYLLAEINPRNLFKRMSDENSFGIRLIDDDANYRFENESIRISADKFYARVIVLEKSSEIVILSIRNDYQYSVDIRMKNLGIYDRSETRSDCTRDPQIISSIRDSLRHDYDPREHLKTIVRKCRCLPYTDKVNYRKFKEVQPTTMGLPFCDFPAYYECSEQNRSTVSQADYDRFRPSCTTIRNHYSVVVYEKPCEKSICPYINFTILLTDYSYVMYEDRYKSTTAQLISQLGGEVGLYTGLSMLGIWELIIFIYARYKKYRRNGKSCKQWLVEIFREINNSGKTGGEETGSDEKELDKENGLELDHQSNTDMERRLDGRIAKETSKNNQRNDERFRKLESKIDEILSVMKRQ